jgi:hypothetical protein
VHALTKQELVCYDVEQDQEFKIEELDASCAPSLEAIIGMRTAVIMRGKETAGPEYK